ncbi:MAG: iron-sulfur cluster insertion protein ErpA [Actinomycetota bacterium]|jgi:iron-sulfur cluster assembly accessory protein
MTGNTLTEKSHGVTLTSAAASKAKVLLEREQRDDLRLRLVVKAGGCSGFRYDLFFDERDNDGDAIVEFDGVQVVIDKKSAPYLEGAEIDYEDSIQASGFQINNPNAQNTCACGDSFN